MKQSLTPGKLSCLLQTAFVFLFLVWVNAAFAQTNNAPGSTSGTNVMELPETIVVGKAEPGSFTTPSAAAAAEQYREIPGGFNVKTTDEMKKGRASNFLDLLQRTPGLFMQSENGVEMSKVSIRGSGIESDDEPLGVEFLLDGISLDQGDGETIIEDFDVNTLKYAEVYRGADALKYGVLTVGGAINLVPLTGYDAGPFSLRVEGGSYGFVNGQVSSAGVDGKFDCYASLSGRYRDGYRDHSRENTELLFVDFGDKINDHLENRVYLTVDQEDRQLPGGLTQDQMYDDPKQADPDAVPFDFKKQWEYGRFADKLSYVNGGEQADATVYYWHRNLEEKDVFSPTNYEQGIQTYLADDGGVGLDSITRSRLFGQDNIFTIGASPAFETEQDHFYQNLGYLGDPGEYGQQGDTIGKDLELSINIPFYAQNQHYLTEKLSLITGLQAMYVVRHFYDYFNDTLDGNQSAKQDFYSLNPKIGLLYELSDKSQIYANVSRAWQPPSFDNMVSFDDGPGVSLVYTPLEPQHAITGEIGTRGTYGCVSWDLAYYYSWVRNELLDLYDASDVDRGDVNVNKTYHQGVEAGLDVELWNSRKTADAAGQRVTFDQTYTLNDFHFVDDPVYGNNRIGGIPIHVYEAELMYETPCGFYAGPNIQANLTRYPVDQQNTLYADAYWLVGFKIGYASQWRKHKYQVFVEAKNLNNEVYAASVDPIPNGQVPADPQVFHPGDGRSFYGGFAVGW